MFLLSKKLLLSLSDKGNLPPPEYDTPIRFDYTGSVQEFIVPKGVKKIKVDCVGARGGSATSASVPGGKGGRVTCVLSVKPGDTLYLYVGRAGQNQRRYGNISDIAFNGGGQVTGKNWGAQNASGGGGGGASDVRLVKASEGSWYDTNHDSWESDVSLLSRVVVAGGGGGFGTNGHGGAGGGLIGESNYSGTSHGSGTGGSQTSGGTNGKGYVGEFGKGGNSTVTPGGAGGGGWYGGCGASNWNSGSGGSSYTHPELCTEVEHTQGYSLATGNGWIVLTQIK